MSRHLSQAGDASFFKQAAVTRPVCFSAYRNQSSRMFATLHAEICANFVAAGSTVFLRRTPERFSGAYC
jgi:hypothetical protein